MEKKKSVGKYILVSVFLLIGWIGSFGQRPAVRTGGAQPADSVKKTKIELLRADKGRADRNKRPDVQELIGNVVFRHDSMYMYCDSAFINQKNNSFEAFSNVRMEQGDTLFIYGDRLFYDGISRIARLRDNVRMINRNTTLTTDSLDYDRVLNKGYYFNGGTLTDEENVLTSDWGEYNTISKQAEFNYEVRLDNRNFQLFSDTLQYNTDSKIATILGPSNICSEENHIYSELGFYNTNTHQAELLNRSELTSGSKRLVGDSLFYDRNLGYGEAFYHVVMNDTVNRGMLTGDYCYYNEQTDSAFVTHKAVAVDYSKGDSIFMHADTMMIVSYNLNTDSLYREMRAYRKVRVFSEDMQGICDSMAFVSRDSCLTMYYDPILWNQNQQLLGERIHVFVNDSTIDWVHVVNQTLTAERKDSIHYNQVSGKEVKGYFSDGEIHKAEFIGNVQIVFYLAEEDSTLMAMNTSVASLFTMYIQNRKMQKAVLSPQPKGVAYPMDQIPPEEMYLKNFVWFDYLRPKSKEDIFVWQGKREGEELKVDARSGNDPMQQENLRDLIKMK